MAAGMELWLSPAAWTLLHSSWSGSWHCQSAGGRLMLQFWDSIIFLRDQSHTQWWFIKISYFLLASNIDLSLTESFCNLNIGISSLSTVTLPMSSINGIQNGPSNKSYLTHCLEPRDAFIAQKWNWWPQNYRTNYAIIIVHLLAQMKVFHITFEGPTEDLA